MRTINLTVSKGGIVRLSTRISRGADLPRHIPRAEEIPRDPRDVHGWVAVSETRFKLFEPDEGPVLRWLEGQQPVRRVGKSIRLYRVP